MEWKPARQQHDLDRHLRNAAPVEDAVKRKQSAREDVGMNGTPARQDRLARTAHVRCIRAFAGHLQPEIGLHAGAHIEIAIVKESPTPVRPLDALEVDGDFSLKLLVDRLATKVAKKHVFRRNRRIRLELEHPVPIALLALQQCLRGRDVRFLELRMPQ